MNTLSQSSSLPPPIKNPKLPLDHQHDNLLHFDLEQLSGSNNFHKYIRNYAS